MKMEFFTMRRILAATDFSTRSDRAVRRATLRAKQFSAELFLVHVVDDKQPDALIRAERSRSAKLLQTMCRTILKMDGLACQPMVKVGRSYQGILQAVEEVGAEVTIVGPHKRQLLLDAFLGTTAERVIRCGASPIVIANALPASFYRRVLLAVDLSPCSAEAVRAAAKLGLDKHANVTVMHAFAVPADTIIARSGITTKELEQYIADAQERAGRDLSSFLHGMGYTPARIVLRPGPPTEAIRACAETVDADLIVVGTHGRSGVGKLLWGSVAQKIAAAAERDVLTVPPNTVNRLCTFS